MKLTRRGWAVAAVVAAAIASGALFGARGLNAIAAPGLVALVAAVVQVHRLDRPEIERTIPRGGARGETVGVKLRFRVEQPFSARVRDEVGDGLAASGNEFETSLTGGTHRYDLRLESRGEHAVGPASIQARDVLGLAAGTFRYPGQQRVLVRPRIYRLMGPRRDDLVWLYGDAGEDRQQFDQLRRYQRGDPLRDVHWKSSAKRPEDDLVVKQFTADDGARSVEIAAAAARGHGDAMADAAASIAAHLLDAGVEVGVSTTAGRIEPDGGPDQRDRVLDHLARAEAGGLPEGRRADAEIVIEADGEDTWVTMDGRRFVFAELAGEGMSEGGPGVPEVATA